MSTISSSSSKVEPDQARRGREGGDTFPLKDQATVGLDVGGVLSARLGRGRRTAGGLFPFDDA
jgi:hypothetical protein